MTAPRAKVSEADIEAIRERWTWQPRPLEGKARRTEDMREAFDLAEQGAVVRMGAGKNAARVSTPIMDPREDHAYADVHALLSALDAACAEAGRLKIAADDGSVAVAAAKRNALERETMRHERNLWRQALQACHPSPLPDDQQLAANAHAEYVARLTAERDEARGSGNVDLSHAGVAIESLSHELDIARATVARLESERGAEVAVAFEAAAAHASAWLGDDGTRDVDAEIRALTPADARAALAAMLDQARQEAYEKSAAELAEMYQAEIEKAREEGRAEGRVENRATIRDVVLYEAAKAEGAAEEREACAKECEGAATFESATTSGVVVERETLEVYLDGYVAGCERSAARIRARATKEEKP